MRALPPAQRLASDLLHGGGSVVLVAPGEHPVFAIALEGRHLALLREYEYGVTVNVDERHFWVAFPPDWSSALAEIRSAMNKARTRSRMRLSEVIVACAPALEQRSHAAWSVTFPGTPVPTEAWLRRGGSSVGLFQDNESVRVVVWAGSVMHAEHVTSPEQFVALDAWLGARLDEQYEAQATERAEAAERQTRVAPSVSEVLRRMEAGKTFQTGGGRAWAKYFWDGQGLKVERFDEGESWIETASFESLAFAIATYPDVFE